MPYPTDITYPTVATDAAWQKKKSVTDKLIKTKVGPALVLAKTKWDAIKFVDLDHKVIAKSVAVATANHTKAKAAWQQVLAARAALKAAWLVADAQKVNPKLASSSKTALAAISVALKAADDRLDKMDDIVPAFQIDVNNTTKAAAANWTNLEIKSGSKVLANAKKAKLESNNTYLATDVDWKVADRHMRLTYLQKKVKVTAHDGAGASVSHDMTLEGIGGDDSIRLK